MRELGLDFQTQRPGVLPIVLLLAGMVLCADQWLEYDAVRQQRDEVQVRLEQARRRAARVETSRRETRPENVFNKEEMKALQQAISAIRVDWTALGSHIDQSVGADVSLLGIRPSVSGKAVQISGEARHMTAALAFVESLRQAPLSDVVLVSHQIKQNDPQRPIVFEISATWKTGS